MTDNTNTPADDSNTLSATVNATGTSSPTSFEIDPAHQHHADAVLAMDPLQVPHTHDIPDGWASSFTLKPTALPPAVQREIDGKLAALGPLSPAVREAKANEFTAAAIRSQRQQLVTKIGVGKDATPYHRELAGIARDVEDLYRQHASYQTQLEEIARYEMETDPATGEVKPVPVYAVTGERAQAYVTQQHDLLRRIRLLVQDDGTPGLEGAKRAKRALHETVTARVEFERQLSERREVKARAETMNRERRINAQAEALASLQRNGG